MDTIQLPFKAEYAKSGRAKCKGCKSNIGKDSLRIAAMVQSAFHDGKQPNWFHESCFFKKQRPASAGDIENFESLRYEDQERIKATVDELGTGIEAAVSGRRRKRSREGNVAHFGIEYAKTDRATCQGCEQEIEEDEVRIHKTVFDTEVGRKALWHHVECFTEMRVELGWLARGDDLSGFKSLSKEDQINVKGALPALKSEDVPEVKKARLEKKDERKNTVEKKISEIVKAQNMTLFRFRDSVKEKMQKTEVLGLLEDNNQEPFPGDTEKLHDQIADMLTFGAIQPCKVCKGKQLIFKKYGYVCNGQLAEWTKCMHLEKEPKRKPVTIAKDLQSKYSFLKKIKPNVETRAIQYIAPSSSTIAMNVAMKNKDELNGPKVMPAEDSLAVDPGSGLEHRAHVYVEGKNKYSEVLGLRDVQRNKNSFYKLQLLKSDVEKKFWIFRSWGRIEADIVGKKLHGYSTLDSAKSVFLKKYWNKTGNHWENREHFKKIPGKKYPIDVEFSDEDNTDAEHSVS